MIRDGNIRYYEYDLDTLYALSEHKSMEPGMCFLPRHAVEVSKCEIGHAYKVTGTAVEVIILRKVNFNFIAIHVPVLTLHDGILPRQYIPSGALLGTVFDGGRVLCWQGCAVESRNGAVIKSSSVMVAPAPVHVPALTSVVSAQALAPEPIAVDIPPVTPVVATSISAQQAASPQVLSPPPIQSELFAAHSSHHHTSTPNEVCYMQLRSFCRVG